MSIVSRYIDTTNVFAPKRTGKAAIVSMNMLGEVDPLITTGPIVKQESRTKPLPSIDPHTYNESYVPLAFMTSDGTPKIYASEYIGEKLQNTQEADYMAKAPTKQVSDLYDKIMRGTGTVTAFNGVVMAFPNSGSMTR